MHKRLTEDECAELERLAKEGLERRFPLHTDGTRDVAAGYAKTCLALLHLVANLRAAEAREKEARERAATAHWNAQGWLDDANRNEAALLDERQRAERAESALRELAAAVREYNRAQDNYELWGITPERIEARTAARKRVDAALAAAGEDGVPIPLEAHHR